MKLILANRIDLPVSTLCPNMTSNKLGEYAITRYPTAPTKQEINAGSLIDMLSLIYPATMPTNKYRFDKKVV